MAEHQQMQQPHQGQQMTAQILNVQGGVATLDEPVPVQIMMPATVVMEEHHQPQEHHQVPQHVQEMHEVVQEAVGATTQGTPPEDPKITNKKELSKQWKSLCKRAKQWCSMHDDSVPNFVMMYLDENRLVWEGPDHMESFISDESVISAFLRTAALSESLIGMEKRGADDTQDISHPAKKQKKAVDTADESQKAVDDEDDVLSAILEKREPEDQDAEQVEGAGGDEKKADVDPGLSQGTDTDQPSQSTSEGQSQGGEGDVLSQVIESVIKDWAPGQGPPPTSQDEGGDANVPGETSGTVKRDVCLIPDQMASVSLIRGSAMSKVGSDAVPVRGASAQELSMSQKIDEALNAFPIKPDFLCACGTVLPNKKLFRLHCKIHHTGPRPFCCQICEKYLSTGQRLKTHMLTHTDGSQKMAVLVGPQRFSCPECPMKFNASLALDFHMKKHGKPFPALDKKAKEHEHIYSVISKQFTCSQCSVTFETRKALKAHIRIHAEEKSFGCERCGKKFCYKSTLRKHMRAHSAKDAKVAKDSDGENKGGEVKEGSEKKGSRKPCVCEQCGKTLSSKSSLKMHKMWVHQGIKPFPCPHCPRQYCQRRDLDHHINITHGGVKRLKVEVNREGRRVVMGRGKYACEICSREFSSRRPLQVHMRIHTGEKPFSCETCDRPFARKSDLVKHERLHSGEKPYECPVCQKRFRAISNMKLHARRSCKYEGFGAIPVSTPALKISDIKTEAVCDDDDDDSKEMTVFTDLTEQSDENVQHIEVTYETDGNVITEMAEGHAIIAQVENTPTDGYQTCQVITIPSTEGNQSSLATIEFQDFKQAVARSSAYAEEGGQFVYVAKNILQEIPVTVSGSGYVPEPSTSDIHMAADTIAKIEAIHNAQVNRECQP